MHTTRFDEWFIYKDGVTPASLPEFVVVQFPSFNGKSCLPDVKNCVAIRPETAEWMSDGRRQSRTQFPLRLAWAITVHKSQGMTLDAAVIDLQGSRFATGLEFVAFSRVKRVEHLLLIPFEYENLKRLSSNKTIQQKNDEDLRLKTLFKLTKVRYQDESSDDDMDVDDDSEEVVDSLVEAMKNVDT